MTSVILLPQTKLEEYVSGFNKLCAVDLYLDLVLMRDSPNPNPYVVSHSSSSLGGKIFLHVYISGRQVHFLWVESNVQMDEL